MTSESSPVGRAAARVKVSGRFWTGPIREPNRGCATEAAREGARTGGLVGRRSIEVPLGELVEARLLRREGARLGAGVAHGVEPDVLGHDGLRRLRSVGNERRMSERGTRRREEGGEGGEGESGWRGMYARAAPRRGVRQRAARGGKAAAARYDAVGEQHRHRPAGWSCTSRPWPGRGPRCRCWRPAGRFPCSRPSCAGRAATPSGSA